jgi:hypothetical protein
LAGTRNPFQLLVSLSDAFKKRLEKHEMDKEKIIEALSAEVSYQTAIRTKKVIPVTMLRTPRQRTFTSCTECRRRKQKVGPYYIRRIDELTKKSAIKPKTGPVITVRDGKQNRQSVEW